MGRWGRWLLARLSARPLLWVVAIGGAARLLLIAATHVVGDGTLFEDDRGYVALAAAARDGLADESRYHRELFWSVSTFTVPLTAVYRLVGPSPLAGQLLAAGAGVAAAAAVVAAARRQIPAGLAFGAGLVVALLPSQVLWSSLVLKDALVWAVLAGLSLAVAAFCGAPARQMAPPLAVIVVLLWLLGHLRLHTLVVACWALVLTAVLCRGEGRVAGAAAALTVAALVPLVLGAGPLGLGAATDAWGEVEETRMANARGAGSAFVSEDDAGAGHLRHLPRGLSAMLLQPYPWRAQAGTALRLASVEMLLWYSLLLVAGAGALAVLRSRSPLWFALLMFGGLTLLYALTEGNLGTAYRHRGELVWAVALLAAHGTADIFGRVRVRCGSR